MLQESKLIKHSIKGNGGANHPTIKYKDMVTAIEPNVSNTGRYGVMQTCAILGIHKSTLRRYTMAGAIKCGFRKQTARKFYLGSEIVRFWKAQL